MCSTKLWSDDVEYKALMELSFTIISANIFFQLLHLKLFVSFWNGLTTKHVIYICFSLINPCNAE